MLRPTLSAGPTALTFLTLAEAKAHCRIDDADSDGVLTSLINAAESYLDGYSGILGRALINQKWVQNYDSFCDRMNLPVGIASSISTVKYYDSSNVQQTLASSVYQLLTDDLGSYVTLKPLQVWPQPYSREDAVEITWVAGYGSAAANVPAAIRAAALLLVGHWYENRENVVIGQTVAELPMAVNSLLAPFRRVGF